MTNPITAAIAPYAGLLKLAGFVAFVGLLFLAGQQWQSRGEQIRTLEAQHVADQGALDLYRQAARDYRKAATLRKEQLDRDRKERKRIQDEATTATTEARAKAREAEARAAAWRDRWRARTGNCQEALAAMAAACPALRDY